MSSDTWPARHLVFLWKMAPITPATMLAFPLLLWLLPGVPTNCSYNPFFRKTETTRGTVTHLPTYSPLEYTVLYSSHLRI